MNAVQVRNTITGRHVGASPSLYTLAGAATIKTLHNAGTLESYNSCNYWRLQFIDRFRNILPKKIAVELYETVPFAYDDLDDSDDAASNTVKRVQDAEPSIYSCRKVCEFYKQLYSTLSDAKRCIDDILGEHAYKFGECAFTVITYVALDGSVVERRDLPTILRRISVQINALIRGAEESELLINMLSSAAVMNLIPSCKHMKRYNAGLREVFSLPELAFQVLLRNGPDGFAALNKLSSFVNMDNLQQVIGATGIDCFGECENYNACNVRTELEVVRDHLFDSILLH